MSGSGAKDTKMAGASVYKLGSSKDGYQSIPETVRPDYKRPKLNELATREFYQREGWFESMCETLFKIKARDTTIQNEVYHGIIHFISCLYCLAVVPQQLSSVGYDAMSTVTAVALTSGIGSIFCGLFANLPFVLAPPTVVTIFHASFLRQNNIGPLEGSCGVMLSGALLMLFGWRPLGELVRHLIPLPIQVGTAVGIGLLTTLAGSTEVDIVTRGEYKILRMGEITPQIIISFVGVFLICIAIRYHIKGSFCIAVILCSLTWWAYDSSFPSTLFAWPTLDTDTDPTAARLPPVRLLTLDLLFLYVLYLNGLVTSLSNLSNLTREDGATPRGRWVFIFSGFLTICGGLLNSAPILVSPESSAAIKEGARTGLSAVVAGSLFLLAAYFGPLFDSIPSAGTSPVLLMIGLILFQNANRIDWRNVSDSAPAFLVLFYIPFTYSIIQGVTLGYIMYLAITLCTGELLENFLSLLLLYVPSLEPTLEGYTCLLPYLTREPSAYRGVGVGVGADGGVGTGVGVGASSSSQSLIPEGGMDGMGRMDMDMGMGGMRMGGMGISADGTESGLGRGVGLGLAQSGQGPTLSLSHPSALTQSPRSALTHSSPSRSRRPSLAPQRSRRGTIIENSGLLAFGLDMSMDIHELEGEEWERGSGGQRSASSES